MYFQNIPGHNSYNELKMKQNYNGPNMMWRVTLKDVLNTTYEELIKNKLIGHNFCTFLRKKILNEFVGQFVCFVSCLIYFNFDADWVSLRRAKPSKSLCLATYIW